MSRNRMGFWLAVLTAGLTAISFSIGIFGTPLNSYPYPYLAPFIPVDFAWLIPAFILMPVFVALTASIHHITPNERKIFSQIALSFAIICATVLMADFFIQLTVVLPSTLKGETAGLSLFTEYNPHGVFVGLEALGYLMMSTSFLSLAPIFNEGRLQKSIRGLFVASFVLAVSSLVGLSLAGYDIVYFELIIISVNWTVLIVSGILLGVLFRRATKS
ncbi:MAG TPA: hypothetical protein VI864_06220 [Candidatus Bathyarchaeia archaeon]|nr:hypothetical protein [Candidatus Bathyarchaeia archaeon]